MSQVVVIIGIMALIAVVILGLWLGGVFKTEKKYKKDEDGNFVTDDGYIVMVDEDGNVIQGDDEKPFLFDKDEGKIVNQAESDDDNTVYVEREDLELTPEYGSLGDDKKSALLESLTLLEEKYGTPTPPPADTCEYSDWDYQDCDALCGRMGRQIGTRTLVSGPDSCTDLTTERDCTNTNCHTFTNIMRRRDANGEQYEGSASNIGTVLEDWSAAIQAKIDSNNTPVNEKTILSALKNDIGTTFEDDFGTRYRWEFYPAIPPKIFECLDNDELQGKIIDYMNITDDDRSANDRARDVAVWLATQTTDDSCPNPTSSIELYPTPMDDEAIQNYQNTIGQAWPLRGLFRHLRTP